MTKIEGLGMFVRNENWVCFSEEDFLVKLWGHDEEAIDALSFFLNSAVGIDNPKTMNLCGKWCVMINPRGT